MGWVVPEFDQVILRELIRPPAAATRDIQRNRVPDTCELATEDFWQALRVCPWPPVSERRLLQSGKETRTKVVIAPQEERLQITV